MPSVWPQTMPQLCIALDQVPIPEWNVEVIVISKLRDGKSKRAKVVYTSYLAIFISSTSSVCCGDVCTVNCDECIVLCYTQIAYDFTAHYTVICA